MGSHAPHHHAHAGGVATEAHAHRTLPEIYTLIDGSRLSATGKDRAKALFARLGEVEGTIHGTPIDKVHLHEVGSLDSIVDIVSTVHALELLGADRIVASPLNVGSGTIRSAHGLYPVPAPATVRLLEGVPVYSGTQRAEMVTPTGALLVTAYATEFGGIPAMRIATIGYGAGARNFEDTPNVLRVLIGEADAAAPSHAVVVDRSRDRRYEPAAVRCRHGQTAGGRRAGCLLHGDSNEEEPAGHAPVRDRGACRAREVDGDHLPRNHDNRRAVPRDDARVSRSRDADRDDAVRPGSVQGRAPQWRDSQRLAGVRRLCPAGRGVRAEREGDSGGGDQGVARHTAVMNPFYITTPIYYINAQPHIGHAYTTMVADAIARSRRLLGDDVFFLTGTDEHGQKVERAAQKAGLKTEVFAEQMAGTFRQMCGDLNISNDDFIRTTEPRHHRASQELWRRVAANGDIYKGDYEGWYCTVDEIFVPETQLVDGKCPTCGNKVERLKEESYYFRLSKYQQPLLDFYATNPDFLQPAFRLNEIRTFIEAGLQDLSVSRTSFQWGIPVPDDPKHVMTCGSTP